MKRGDFRPPSRQAGGFQPRKEITSNEKWNICLVRASWIAGNSCEEFRAFIRAQIREALLRIVEQELEELCGRRHHPDAKAEYFRSAGVDSPVYVDGRRENLRRPRVRQRLDNGETKEFFLKSWRLNRDLDEWMETMIRTVLCGCSAS